MTTTRSDRARRGWGRFAVPLVALLVAVGVSSPPAAAAVEEYVRYYAVESATENLDNIAQRLLGSSGRSTDIFNLNAGRAQPDGAALSDPNTLHVGWYLVLPWDAAGAGVQYGVLPKTAPPTKNPTSGQTPGTNGGAGNGSGPTGQPTTRAPGVPRTTRTPGPAASVPQELPPPPPASPACVPSTAATTPSNWAMKRIGADQAARLSRGSGQLVAIVDSGVDGRAPQLRGQVAVGVNVMTGDERGDADCLGTGTAMAGLVVAKPVGDQTFTGVAPEAIVIPVRVVTDGTAPGKADYAAAIDVAVSAGATVVALGSYVDISDPVVMNALRTAVNHDVVVVATAPIGRTGAQHPPSGVILVGGVAEDGGIAAEYTPGLVDVVAPGVNVTSVGANGATSFVGSGTQYAVALTAGAVALVRSTRPELTAEQVAHRLTVTADSIAGAQTDNQFGNGMINLMSALTLELPEEGATGLAGESVEQPGNGIGARVAFLITLLVGLVLTLLLVYRFRRSMRQAVTEGGDPAEASPGDPLAPSQSLRPLRGMDRTEG